MDEISSRLRQARTDAGFGDASAAAKAFGFTYPTYAGHENGSRGLKRDALTRYARAFNVSLEWLMTGRGAKSRKSSDWQIDGEPYLPVPMYDIRAAAGAGALVEDGEPTAHQVFREGFLRGLTRASMDQLSVIQVSGDSMWETLHDGDAVLVDRSVTKIARDGIYILMFDGELLVKRCQRDLSDGAVLIMSDNPRYQTVKVPAKRAEQLRVIGRVVWIGRALG